MEPRGGGARVLRGITWGCVGRHSRSETGDPPPPKHWRALEFERICFSPSSHVSSPSSSSSSPSTPSRTTMTAVPPPRTSPRWDSRNEGFVSPARLQQWKEENERKHSFSSPPPQPPQPPSDPIPEPAPATRPTPQRRMTDASNGGSPSKPQHRSKPSFTAFFSRKSSQQDEQPPLSSPPARPTPQGSDSQMSVPQGQSPIPAPKRAPSNDDSSVATSPRVLQKENPLSRSQTNPAPASAPAPIPPLHPEIRSVVQLTLAHAHKVYFSGPLVRRIERQPDGQKPTKDDGWREVWAQLGGTTLSVWDMEEIREASKQGKQVPPAYINVTDAVSTVRWILDVDILMCLRRLRKVRARPRLHRASDVAGNASATVHERAHPQHGGLEPLPILMSLCRSVGTVDCRPPSVGMGEIALGGDLYCPFDSDLHERRYVQPPRRVLHD